MSIEVELKVYDGPLDLLLSLIEKNKINIFDIPIVEITAQYLEQVRKLQKEDMTMASEFMVMAAELLAIKCRMLLPADDEEGADEADPRAELVRRLLEYKTYKYMSYELKDILDRAGDRFFKDETIPKAVASFRPVVEPADVIEDLTFAKLHEIFSSVIKRQEDSIDPIRSNFGTIEKEEVSLSGQIGEVIRIGREKKRFSFRDLIESSRSKTKTVVTFLAVLELIKYGALRAEQAGFDDDMILEAGDDVDVSSLLGQIEKDYGTEGAEEK